MLCVVGAYALNNTMQSVYVLLLFMLVGYVLVKLGFPLAPLILGLILGDQIEINLVRAIMTDANPWLFLTRPISGLLLLAAAASVMLAIYGSIGATRPGWPRKSLILNRNEVRFGSLRRGDCSGQRRLLRLPTLVASERIQRNPASHHRSPNSEPADAK